MNWGLLFAIGSTTRWQHRITNLLRLVVHLQNLMWHSVLITKQQNIYSHGQYKQVVSIWCQGWCEAEIKIVRSLCALSCTLLLTMPLVACIYITSILHVIYHLRFQHIYRYSRYIYQYMYSSHTWCMWRLSARKRREGDVDYRNSPHYSHIYHKVSCATPYIHSSYLQIIISCITSI